MVKLHHINIATHDVEALDKFYREALGLDRLPGHLEQGRILNQTSAPATFLSTGGDIQLHLATIERELGFRTGHIVNPVARGHIAFRTENIEAVKAKLTQNNVHFSDYGEWAMKGWNQIFFYDPAGSVVEVHQVD
jgi:glyoxylase I family protein